MCHKNKVNIFTISPSCFVGNVGLSVVGPMRVENKAVSMDSIVELSKVPVQYHKNTYYPKIDRNKS